MRLRNPFIVALALGSALALGTGEAMAEESVEVAMAPQSGSGQSGQAALYAEGDQTRVIVTLDNPAPGPEPAHIHSGSCPSPDPMPLYPLSSVVNGRSETLLNIKLGALLVEPMAINVHKSPQEIAVYVSCGDLVLDDDFTRETAIDSVRENAREGTSDELKRDEERREKRR